MENLTNKIEDLKLLADYCGLSFSGINEDGYPEFTGTSKQQSDFEAIKDNEVYQDDEGFYIETEDEGENQFIISKIYIN